MRTAEGWPTALALVIRLFKFYPLPAWKTSNATDTTKLSHVKYTNRRESIKGGACLGKVGGLEPDRLGFES